jgi:hypothetical protein
LQNLDCSGLVLPEPYCGITLAIDPFDDDILDSKLDEFSNNSDKNKSYKAAINYPLHYTRIRII